MDQQGEWEQLLARLATEHQCVPSDPIEAERQVADFESRFGVRLPDDLRSFYLRYRSANFFDGNFRMVPIGEIEQGGTAIFGNAEGLPPGWFAFCDHCGNGNWMVIDLSHPSGKYPILDLDHDDTQYKVAALSFGEFLNDVMSKGEDFLYYSTLGVSQYGDAECAPGSRWMRVTPVYQSEWEGLGPDVGPDLCASDGCTRLRARQSVLCRRHHFGQFHALCPFEDDEDVPSKAIYSQEW